MLNSEEYQEYPELFSASVLANTKIDNIKEILHNEELKSYSKLISASVLATSKLADIKNLLSQEYWQDERFKHLLAPSILTNSKSMIKKFLN